MRAVRGSVLPVIEQGAIHIGVASDRFAPLILDNPLAALAGLGGEGGERGQPGEGEPAEAMIAKNYAGQHTNEAPPQTDKPCCCYGRVRHERHKRCPPAAGRRAQK